MGTAITIGQGQPGVQGPQGPQGETGAPGPVGSVIAWPTGSLPSDYVECDGTPLSTTTYASLYAVIGTLYGTDGAGTFRLPDYRGIFLRGWAHGSTNDPDRASRLSYASFIPGSTMAAGDNVGTIQADQFESHIHSGGYSRHNGYAGDNGSIVSYHFLIGDANTGSTGGNETRPVNENVMYVIKYR